MQNFIWVPFSSFTSGDVIAKGHWGKVILDRPRSHDHAVRELIYEEVRREKIKREYSLFQP